MGKKRRHISIDEEIKKEAFPRDEVVVGSEHEENGQNASESDQESIEPFNLVEEREQGSFDEHGNYFRNRDLEEDQDNWLEGISKEDIRRAREMKNKIQKSSDEEITSDLCSVYTSLIPLLKGEETVSLALSRCGKRQKNPSSKKPEPLSKEQQSLIEQITTLCNQALSIGNFDIYEQTIESMSRHLKSHDDISDDSYYYKWNENGLEYGPFSTDQMRLWALEGFFDHGIWIRNGSMGEYKDRDSVLRLLSSS